MPAPKGHERYGGRIKGTPNKKTKFVQDILDSQNFNLIEEILKNIKEVSNKADKAKLLLQLVPYCYPKLTSIVHSGDIDLGETEQNNTRAEQLLRAAKIAAEIK